MILFHDIMHSMDNQRKFLLLFPPLWTIAGPHLALPTLVSQLKSNGFSAKAADLNIDFINHVLTEDYINKSLKTIKKQYFFLEQNKSSFLNKNDSEENIILNYKYSKLKQALENFSYIDKLSLYAEKIHKTFRNPEYFYNYKNLIKAQYFLRKIINICSLVYLPAFIDSDFNYRNKFMMLNYTDIKQAVFDELHNMFLDFYKTKLEHIKEQNYSYIGISIGSFSQLIGGLTLANLLKTHTKAHINIGGIFFYEVTESLKKNPEFFDLFADSVSYGEGENSIVELAKYINEEIPIEEVHNLIYKKNNKIIVNPLGKQVILSQISTPDYSDYDFTKYFSPEPILPLQTSRGCYWNKCTFCDHSYGKTYTVKRIDDLIKEIKENKEKYNASAFDIIDESIHPKFLDKFCDALIENNLNIKFKMCSRFEEEISYALLKKAYKAGLELVLWGFETGNERIHKLINKGVNFKNRLKILKMANKAGINNLVFAFYDFPTETFKEAMDTLEFFVRNHKYIQTLKFGRYCLLSLSSMSKEPDKFKIVVSDKYEDFSFVRNYSVEEGMTENEKADIQNRFHDILLKYYKNKIFIHLPFFEQEHLLLYNNKYNLKNLKKIRLKKEKTKFFCFPFFIS